MKYMVSICMICMPLIMVAQSKDELAVAAAVESLKKAMIDADIPTLEKITHEKLSYGHSSGLVEDQKSFLEKFKTGQSDFVSIDLSDQTITIVGQTALVRHLLRAETNDNGKAGQAQIKVLLVWVKQKNAWVLFARQAVRVV